MAIGASTFTSLGTGVSDIFNAIGTEESLGYQEEAAQFEEQNYEAASKLATQNAQYTATSTAIQQGQQERQLYTSLGKTQAQVAGAGLAQSGSAVDLLRSSAQQGATATAALGQQGLITEAGYQEQATAYSNMASAAAATEQAEETSAKYSEIGGIVGGVMNIAGAAASLFTPAAGAGGSTSNPTLEGSLY